MPVFWWVWSYRDTTTQRKEEKNMYRSYYAGSFASRTHYSGVGRILVQGNTWLPKGYHALWGGPGCECPRMVAKFKIIKRFKVLENESIFQKYQHFSCPKNPFFLRKLSKNWTFYKDFLIFSKNYFANFNFYGAPSKSREIPVEFYYLVEKIIEKIQKMA